MPFNKGFNFRSTAPFVTDGANEFPIFKNTDYSGGQGYGWSTVATVDDEDRNRDATTDRRLAGVTLVFPGGLPRTFRVDLPSAGTYAVRLAVGDFGSVPNWKVVIKDGTNTLLTVAGTTSGAATFFDASGVERTAAAWPAENAIAMLTFAGATCNLVVSDNGGAQSGLAHFSINNTPVASGAIEVVTTARMLVQAIADVATDGFGSYTYQWYRSTSNGFTPGVGNILAGKTARLLCDYTVSPATTYYYKCVVTDVSAATATSAQLTVTTASGAASLEAGFTSPAPTTASQYAFVSSGGNNGNDGLMPSRAKATVAAGYALLRSGQPDWLMIKRGDTFVESLNTAWAKSGASSVAKMVVWTYGTGNTRPILKCGANGFLDTSGTPDFLHFRGLEASAHTRIPGDPAFIDTTGSEGVRWKVGSTGLVFEDMDVHHFTGNWDIGPASGGSTGVQILRCQGNDSYNALGGHSQGLFIEYSATMLVSECLFDHNGWHATQSGAEATVFNHGIYESYHSTDNDFTSNIISRSAATGIKAGCGGDMAENVLIDNPIGITHGGLTNGNDTGYWGTITDSYIEGSSTINGAGRGYAIAVSNVTAGVGKGLTIDGVIFNGNDDADVLDAAIYLAGADDPTNAAGVNQVTISNCIARKWYQFARFASTLVAGAVASATALNDLIMSNNVATNSVASVAVAHACPVGLSEETFSGNHYNSANGGGLTFSIEGVSKTLSQWKTAVEATADIVIPAYADPDRSVASYSLSIGGAGTTIDFIAQCRLQRWGNWRDEYTASAVLAYIQAGFTLEGGTLTAALISLGPVTASSVTINTVIASSGGVAPLVDVLQRSEGDFTIPDPTRVTVTSPDTTVVANHAYKYRVVTTDSASTNVVSNLVGVSFKGHGKHAQQSSLAPVMILDEEELDTFFRRG